MLRSWRFLAEITFFINAHLYLPPRFVCSFNFRCNWRFPTGRLWYWICASYGCFRTGFRKGETSIWHIDLVTFEGLPRCVYRSRVFLFANSPISRYCFLQYRPVPSLIPHSVEIVRIDFFSVLVDSALKNRVFLRVVASLLANGSGVGVRKGFKRVGGAILSLKWFVYNLITKSIIYVGCGWLMRKEICQPLLIVYGAWRQVSFLIQLVSYISYRSKWADSLLATYRHCLNVSFNFTKPTLKLV